MSLFPLDKKGIFLCLNCLLIRGGFFCVLIASIEEGDISVS